MAPLGKQKSPGDSHKLTGANSGSISGSFASGKHIDLQVYEGEAALLYQIQTLQEDIEELRRYVTNEATGSVIDLKGIDTSALPTSAPAQKNALWIEVAAKGAKYLRST